MYLFFILLHTHLSVYSVDSVYASVGPAFLPDFVFFSLLLLEKFQKAHLYVS